MSPVKKIYHHIRGDAFLKNNVIFFVGSLSVAFFNYLYYPVMGRVFSVEEFGEVQTIFSLVFISGVVLTVFRMMVLHIATNETHELKVESEKLKVDPNPFVTRHSLLAPLSHDSKLLTSDSSRSIPALFTLSLLVHAPFLIGLVIFSPLISRYFSFESHWSFVFFAMLLLLSIYQTFYSSYLHGKNSYVALSISNILGAGGKLVLSFGLVALGLSVNGAVIALVIVSLLTLLYMKKKTHGLSLTFTPSSHIRHVLLKEMPYGLLIFVSLGFVTLLYSVDVIIVKRMFSPEVAGLYSGIATVARIIFFATASVSAVLLSSVTLHGGDANIRVLKKALLLVTALGGGLLVVFAMFSTGIITLLIGAKYVSYAFLLGEMSLYLFVVSLLNLTVSYLLALKSRALYPVTACGVLMLGLVLYLHHETPEKVVVSFICGSAVSLVLSFVAILSQRK
jgi:O-antigen/teichoic acid export membrane protein